jgi:hypothetical protein
LFDFTGNAEINYNFLAMEGNQSKVEFLDKFRGNEIEMRSKQVSEERRSLAADDAEYD